MGNGPSFREETGDRRNAGRGHYEYERERRRRSRSWNPTDPTGNHADDIYKDDREIRGFYEGPRRDRVSADREELIRGFPERSPGGHRGKGPKGYTRSDERIREDVCDRLYDDDRLDASNIEVDVLDGLVTLTGEVDDRMAKHRAEDLAADSSGVKDVRNSLRIAGNSR